MDEAALRQAFDARLLARPTASLSLEAQQRREQRKRQFGA